SCSSSSPKTNFTRLRLALFVGGRSLLARKARVYRVLERTAPIKRVYSDSELDFWSGAKNYLVTDRKLSLG
ncbi:hypothetical protein, partial [Pandoraea morbifera]|uniref:hypothetical protein n=1 Tax=Pandoraea morbifera TaxID=2508300 RepID=UPI001C2CED02